MSDELQAWVGCLACYNAGDLRGQWVPALDAGNVTPETLHGGPTSHEELWVMDWDIPADYVGDSVRVFCEMSPADAQRLAEHLEELDESERAPYVLWCLNAGEDAATADIDSFRDAYCGAYESMAEYAEDLATDLGLVSGADRWPFTCIDWERAGRELEYDGYWIDGCHVFRSV